MPGKHSVNLSISAGWLNLQPDFQRKRDGEGFTSSQILDGGCWGRWVCGFSGELVVQFSHENKQNSEIFNKKKSLLTKLFFSVSLNSEFSYF